MFQHDLHQRIICQVLFGYSSATATQK